MNNALKGAIVTAGLKQIDVAKEMGLNPRVFNRKINRMAQKRTVNGRAGTQTYKFTESEREYLKKRFNVNVI